MNRDFDKQFLTSTDESGRFIVFSEKTRKKYYVEPLNGSHVQWGDVNPATKKIEGNYGGKHKGSIGETESLITADNGFENIFYSSIGESPFSVIQKLEKQ